MMLQVTNRNGSNATWARTRCPILLQARCALRVSLLGALTVAEVALANTETASSSTGETVTPNADLEQAAAPSSPVALTTPAVTTPARQQPPGEAPPVAPTGTDPASAEVDRLEELFRYFDSEYREFQLWGALAAIGSAAVTIPMGFFIRKHSDPNSLAAPLVLGLGAGELAGGIVLLAEPGGSDSDLAKLSTSLSKERATNRPSSEILRFFEAEWKQRADAARSLRHIWGVATMSVGVLGLGAGSYFAISDVSGVSRSDRTTFSATCLGVGGISLILGVRSFLLESPVELSWKVRRAGKPLHSSRLLQLDMAPLPLPGGGALAIGGIF